MICLSLALLTMKGTTNLFVSETGDDRNPGSKLSPLRTFEGAQIAARKHSGERVAVMFSTGIYRLTKSIVFTKEDSGSVNYSAQPGAKVSITGSVAFQPQWKPYSGEILQCSVPEGFDTEQLFINGEQQILARYPNEDLSVRIFHGYAKDAISPERVATWKDPRNGYLHAMHTAMWGDFHYRILGKNADGKLELEGGWQNNRRMGMHDEYRFVEGIFEELDSPGEWFLDRNTRRLYYYPKPGMDLTKTTVEGVSLRSLVEFRGAEGITLSGFTFRHAARTFMDNKEPLLRSDWTTYRGGAILFSGAKDCKITDSTLTDLGGNAIFVDGMNRKIAIQRCLIENVGGNGVAFVGRADAVRSPLFEYNQRQGYASMDKTPGPKNDNYPADCLVEDCLITRTGRVEKQTAPVQIEIASRITVRYCSIYDVPRAGINIGDGCFGGHLIEGCDVFDTVLETGDHGSFNSWGRDRYWGLTDVDMNLGEHPELSKLDMVEPNILRNNRWRCDHGWDIDLDDGSSNYIIQNNLCLNGGLKNREGFNRLVDNNIVVGNSFHPHVWFKNSGDVFTHNIVFTQYQPIQVAMPWGKEVNDNLLYEPKGDTQAATVLANQSGRDKLSLQGDALFVDPAKGDFRVKPGSPVLKLGFKNFAMDRFGVRTPGLRKLAKQPKLTNAGSDAEASDQTDWLGATIKNLVDPGEISATGSAKDSGVLVFAVSKNSQAAKLGLKALDVIREIDGKPVKSVKELISTTQLMSTHKIVVWRNQGIVTLPK